MTARAVVHASSALGVGVPVLVRRRVDVIRFGSIFLGLDDGSGHTDHGSDEYGAEELHVGSNAWTWVHGVELKNERQSL